MAQKALADEINISHRTIAKWERGMGCPDVSLLRDLTAILEEMYGGEFYVCCNKHGLVRPF